MDDYQVWASCKDPEWHGNGKGGIGGTKYFKWLKANEVGYRAPFDACWAIFSHRFPRYGGEPYKTIARQIHIHYYECGAGSGDPNADSFGKLFPEK